jgi:predicted transcriptional regulator
MKSIIIRLPDDLHAALKRLKEQTDVPTNRRISRLLRQEIESLRELKYEEQHERLNHE